MAVDPTQINNQLAQQLPTNNVGRISAAALVAALTVGSGGTMGITSWVTANFQPLFATLPVCTPGSSVAPVPAGQPFLCGGILAFAQ